jgi:competence protein ComEC
MQSGTAVLVSDPEHSGHAIRSLVKLNERHYEAWATGAFAKQVQTMRAGDRIQLQATVRPLSGKRTAGLRRRHVAATLTVTSMHPVPSNSITVSLPNGLRNLLEDGAGALSTTNRPLFTGLLYGDDRLQSEESVAEFRDSGLAHLTAVSGANVAFVLVLLAPLFRRFALFGRFVCGTTALLVFGALTRWEPSVVRAEAMAAVVMYGTFLGRQVSLVRSIALAASAALLLDPFLVGSIGFLFSLSACAGMAAFGNALSEKLPGAPAFRKVIAFSIAAQVGVAPLQLLVFNSLPLVGLVTNVLADPVAGFVMVWGLPAGLLAGTLGGSWAWVLHIPTTLMLDWIRFVAHTGALAQHDHVHRWLVFLVPFAALVSWKRRSAAVLASPSPGNVGES